MRHVTIQYHCDGQWWADSPDLPNYTAVANSFAELRDLVLDGVEFAAGEPVVIVEEAPPFIDATTEGESTP
jgi:predicted RNase H-like HicB family nuclease